MNWSIRAKIFGGYSLAIAILVSLSVLSFLSVSRLVDAARWLDHTREVLGNIDEYQMHLNEAESALRGFLLTGREEYLKKMAGVEGRVKENTDALVRLAADNPAQAARLRRVLPVIEAKLHLMDELAGTRRVQGAEAAQNEVLLGKGKELMDQIQAINAELRGEETTLLERRTEDTETRVKLFRQELLIGVVAAALLLFLIGHAIAGNISRPLGLVTRAAERIAAGNPEVELPSEARGDEVGQLAASFRRMSLVLGEVSAVNTRIAQGDLSVVVKPQSADDKFGAAHEEMIRKLSHLIAQVQRSCIQVNTSINEIAATAKEQKATAGEVATTTAEINATSKEISATSRELVKTVHEVTAVAEHTATLANSGQAGLLKMQETMQQVTAAGASINAKLAVLNEKAGNINQVVITITKVADQTNLLSLNAAIEAEKAGEYGRGFAVVATEIRRLADQTAVATFDIEQMVKDMQSAVSAGVMGMDKFSEEVRRGVVEVQQVSAQLGEIIQQVQALTPRFEAVNEGMQAQSTGAQQISDALAQLGEAARQTAESLRQSTEAIEQLNGVSQGLKSGVEKFRLG